MTRLRVRFSDGLMPKVGAASTIRSGRGIDARFRSGDSVRGAPPGLPWEMTVSSVRNLLPFTHEAGGRQVVSLARRQVDGAVADAAHHAVGQQAGQGSVDRRVRLAYDACQFCRVDERHPAEGFERMSFGHGHMLRLRPHLAVSCLSAPINTRTFGVLRPLVRLSVPVECHELLSTN